MEIIGVGTSAEPLVPVPAPRRARSGQPQLPRTYVPRRRLWEQLDRAMTGAVTLLVAPAGAGKTLGVTGWLRSRPIDSEDARWVYGDHLTDPQHLERLLDEHAASVPGDPARAGPRLLVIDDAHLLPAACLRVVDTRLNVAPESIRLVLLSRWDLPLTRLIPELLGHFTVLRGGVLRLDADESATLIAGHSRSTAPAVVEAITEYAQGWCAAVVLAARAVGAAPDPAAAARRYADGDFGVADRVASEVFAALDTRHRHVLLCVGHEDGVTAETAAHLSHDPEAGEVLAALESTGLLVTSMQQGGDDPTRYRIHPLLVEVIRRRLATGGVDVERARATVARAVELDLARGDLEHCFDRLVAVLDDDLAADVLACCGVTMVTRGHGDVIAAFARRRPEVVQAHRDTWFPVALERWTVGDVDRGHHWVDRALGWERERLQSGQVDGSTDGWRVACLRLMRARLGREPIDAAVDFATEVVQSSPPPSSLTADQATLPQLLTELGATQNWTGDLAHAEANLTAAIGLCRTRNLAALTASAASHLALTQYMCGREQACADIAEESLDMLRRVRSPSALTSGRASLALRLAELSAPARREEPDAPGTLPPAHLGDLCTRFWMRTYQSHLALLEGSVADAERILTAPLELPVNPQALPRHLHVGVLVERACLATLASNWGMLKEIDHQLAADGAFGEAAFVAGLRADLAGDRQTAATQLAAASTGSVLAQPPVRALALACEAQIRAALGGGSGAMDRLRAAVTASEVGRNAVPFLGWTHQGLPMAALLMSLRAEGDLSAAAWCDELIAATEAVRDLVIVVAPATATAREMTPVGHDTLPMLPALSPRERDVLLELARGSTYADIAANLFVSENTVKTHVSSLYSKLAASRRSEALAGARRMGLV
jgi:LuxR family maltose regulon positive regulatory protein